MRMKLWAVLVMVCAGLAYGGGSGLASEAPTVAPTVAGAEVAGAVAGPGVTSTCPSGQTCVWSGTNYTGSMAVVPDWPWMGCVTAAELGLAAVRSAQRNGVPCSLVASLHADTVCGRPTSPEYVQNLTPNISRPRSAWTFS
ncbi:MAG TPA: peptidase inhibitor family I36 protein [Pseudonocardiaceae bacterium]